jgi:hypothetical protein
MSQLEKRLVELEEANARKSVRPRRKKILCARVPVDASTSKIEELAARAEEQDADFRCYVYDGQPDGREDPLPKLYVLHPDYEVPREYVNQVMRDHHSGRRS